MRILGLVWGLVLVAGCAILQQQTGTETVVIELAKVQQIREILGLPPCPSGTTAMVLGLEMATGGGATVTRRCK